jgi:O-acetyl-ADP-ribose deacetylase
MSDSIKINDTEVKVVKDDLTAMEVEAIVFYARADLQLGSGYGNAIATRGGPSIKKELDAIGKAKVTDAIVTEAGMLKTKFIIHSVGPAFQEEDMESKLKSTIDNTLKVAAEKGFNQVAFPIMGSGFYGVAPDASIQIMIDSLKEHLSNSTSLKEVILCGNDNREYRLIASKLIN